MPVTDFDSWAGGFEFTPDNYDGMQAAKTITGITKANPGEVTTSAAHGYSTSDVIYIDDVGGMTEVNGNSYTITVTDTDTFTIGEDTSSHTTYTSGGTAEKTDSDGDFSNLLSGQPVATMTSGHTPVFRKRHGVVGLLYDGTITVEYDFPWTGEFSCMASGDLNAATGQHYFFGGRPSGANSIGFYYQKTSNNGGILIDFNAWSSGTTGNVVSDGDPFVLSGGASPINGTSYAKLNSNSVVSAVDSSLRDPQLSEHEVFFGKHRTTASTSGSFTHRILFFNRCEFRIDASAFADLQTEEMALLGL